MTETGTGTGAADVFEGGPGPLHTHRIRGRGRSALVLWVGGTGEDPDRVLTLPGGGRRRVPVFVTARQARLYADRRGRRPVVAGAGVLDLTRVQRWLADPARRRLPPWDVLDAWNFFEDLDRGVGGRALPRQGPVHNSAYRKLFDGECATWTPHERRAVRELLAAGTELWEFCPVVVNPPAPGRQRDRARRRSRASRA
ncbi:hypothetical protein [Streptomyces sp. NPDC058953]|uniref:hypothetical protein n=1 Tax=unclassified Streptomyces TaxID=2593676 RepID=UPI0036A341F2